MAVAVFEGLSQTNQLELTLIELQGTLEVVQTAEHAQKTMSLSLDPPQLRFGHQLLEGVRVPLPLPLALVKKASAPSCSDASLGNTMEQSATKKIGMEVRHVFYEKLVFSSRPKHVPA